jgi:hypothetical protein
MYLKSVCFAARLANPHSTAGLSCPRKGVPVGFNADSRQADTPHMHE